MGKEEVQKLMNPGFTDLNPIMIGWSKDQQGKNNEFSPMRSYVLMHYVAKGDGILYVDDEPYPIGPGQCFLMMPWANNRRLTICDPMDTQWIGFTGTMSHDFSALPHVFDVPEGLLPHLRSKEALLSASAYDLAADLMMLRSKLIPAEQITHETDYVQFVMDHVHASYQQKLSVESIADLMSLDRSYLSRLFKKKTGQTLQSYILEVRLMEAKRCLMEANSVKEAAAKCGFSDQYIFSKLFQRKTGFSPSEWKKIALYNLTTLRNSFPEARAKKLKEKSSQ